MLLLKMGCLDSQELDHPKTCYKFRIPVSHESKSGIQQDFPREQMHILLGHCGSKHKSDGLLGD